MRLTKEQADTNRRRVLDEASRLFRERGFEGIGVAELMQAAGFTHGGFYNHFGSKGELAAEVTRDIMAAAAAKLLRKKPIGADETHEAFADYARLYLSTRTRDDPGRSCPIASLGPDVVRQADAVRETFADGLHAYVAALATLTPAQDENGARAEAITAIATMMGGLLLARATAGVDEDFSREILDIVCERLVAGHTLTSVVPGEAKRRAGTHEHNADRKEHKSSGDQGPGSRARLRRAGMTKVGAT